MQLLNSFSATTIVGAIDSSQVNGIQVVALPVLPAVGRAWLAFADGNEMLTYTGFTGSGPYTLTGVVRGADGGLAANHAASAVVFTGVLTTSALPKSPLVLTISGSAFGTDASLSNHFRVTLNGATITASAPTNPTDGQRITYELIQDATGTRTVSWNAAFNFGATGAPTLTVTASKRDLVIFIYSASASAWLFAGVFLGY